MTEQPEEKYHWIVVFRKGGKLYPYLYRTVTEMTLIVKANKDRSGSYPHRVWAIINDEVHKVDVI